MPIFLIGGLIYLNRVNSRAEEMERMTLFLGENSGKLYAELKEVRSENHVLSSPQHDILPFRDYTIS